MACEQVLIMRHDLDEDPKVRRLAGLVGADVDLVLGKLWRLWRYVGRHTDDGLLEYAGLPEVDAIVGLPGFAAALCQVRWLEVGLLGARVLGFEQYIGVQGMRKILTAWLKAHPAPRGRGARGAPGFLDFWAAYPRKTSRKKALDRWESLQPDEALRRRIMDALRAQVSCDQWLRGVIPHAETWLNQERWNDEPVPVAHPGRVQPPPGKYAAFSAGAVPAAVPPPAPPAGQAEEPGGGRSLFADDDPPAGGG